MPTTTTNKPHAGRVALVTGAARGIGQAIAVGLAERGATVVIGDIEDVTETTKLIAASGSSALAAGLDISDPAVVETVRRLVADELGRVDILVNNAAIFEAATWDDLDFALWQRIMRVNLNGPMLMCKAFLPLMRGQGWGRVINVASATVAIAKSSLDRLSREQDGRHRLHACTVCDLRRRRHHDQRRTSVANPHRNDRRPTTGSR
jgi:NAD(P)-dependent dehydrogenase (short-subunit alcohol dehydrogenase family)